MRKNPLLAACLLLCWGALVLAEDCTPLYVRIFYSPEPDADLRVDMRAMFNTFDECSDSFLMVKFLNSHMEFPCTP